MRHVISAILIVGAVFAAGASWGPLYFGAPIVGVVLLLTAVGFEFLFWRRLVRERRH